MQNQAKTNNTVSSSGQQDIQQTSTNYFYTHTHTLFLHDRVGVVSRMLMKEAELVAG